MAGAAKFVDGKLLGELLHFGYNSLCANAVELDSMSSCGCGGKKMNITLRNAVLQQVQQHGGVQHLGRAAQAFAAQVQKDAIGPGGTALAAFFTALAGAVGSADKMSIDDFAVAIASTAKTDNENAKASSDQPDEGSVRLRAVIRSSCSALTANQARFSTACYTSLSSLLLKWSRTVQAAVDKEEAAGVKEVYIVRSSKAAAPPPAAAAAQDSDVVAFKLLVTGMRAGAKGELSAPDALLLAKPTVLCVSTSSEREGRTGKQGRSPASGGCSFSFWYGVALALGGVIGRVSAGSNVSLVSGVLSGAYFVNSSQEAHFRKRRALTLVVAAFLTLLMANRFRGTGKFMPAGLVSLLSAYQVYNVASK